MPKRTATARRRVAQRWCIAFSSPWNSLRVSRSSPAYVFGVGGDFFRTKGMAAAPYGLVPCRTVRMSAQIEEELPTSYARPIPNSQSFARLGGLGSWGCDRRWQLGVVVAR